MAPYLSAKEAKERLLERFGIDTEIFAGDAEAASDDLDGMAPFKGIRPNDQAREWPRWGFTANEDLLLSPPPPPEPVLDWVALRAFQLATDEAPAVKSEGAGRVSVTYLHGKASQTEKRMASLLSPYILWTGGAA